MCMFECGCGCVYTYACGCGGSSPSMFIIDLFVCLFSCFGDRVFYFFTALGLAKEAKLAGQ